MIEKGHEESYDGIGDDKEKDIEEEGFEVERKDGKSWSIFANEIERRNIGHESSEEHIDLEDEDHLCHLVVAHLRNSCVVRLSLRNSDDPAED